MPDNATITLASRVILSPRQISSQLAGEIVIMDLHNGVYHGAQGVAAFIWNLLGSPISIQDICRRVTGEYEVDEARCQTDVIALIQQLLDQGLVKLVHSPEKISLP